MAEGEFGRAEMGVEAGAYSHRLSRHGDAGDSWGVKRKYQWAPRQRRGTAALRGAVSRRGSEKLAARGLLAAAPVLLRSAAGGPAIAGPGLRSVERGHGRCGEEGRRQDDAEQAAPDARLRPELHPRRAHRLSTNIQPIAAEALPTAVLSQVRPVSHALLTAITEGGTANPGPGAAAYRRRTIHGRVIRGSARVNGGAISSS